MYAATATILRKENPIFREKNRFLAFFSCVRRTRLKKGKGWLLQGKDSPVHQPVKIYFDRLNYRNMYLSTKSTASTYISGVTFLPLPLSRCSTT